MRNVVDAIVTSESRIQPVLPFGRTGRSTCTHPSGAVLHEEHLRDGRARGCVDDRLHEAIGDDGWPPYLADLVARHGRKSSLVAKVHTRGW